MSLDLLSAIELTAGAAVVSALLAFTLAPTARGRLAAATWLGLWFALVVGLGASHALDNARGIGVPGLGVAVVLPIALLSLLLLRRPQALAALSAIPLPGLIAVHAIRLLGYSFILLQLAGRLPAPFAPAAGWGDMFVGATALPVAWIAARQGAGARWLVLGWNLIGLIDLISAITLGATSSPGPLQLFTGPADSALMVTLPWILIPGFLVPGLAVVHLAIFHRLGTGAAHP